MACGTVLQKTLQPGEKILVDTDSVLCFEQSITLDIQWVGNAATCCCGGEGYVPPSDVAASGLFVSLSVWFLTLLLDSRFWHSASFLTRADCSTPR
jgi:Mitochondrial biogenesis AIM24